MDHSPAVDTHRQEKLAVMRRRESGLLAAAAQHRHLHQSAGGFANARAGLFQSSTVPRRPPGLTGLESNEPLSAIKLSRELIRSR